LSSEDPQVSQASHTPEPAAPAAAVPVVLQGPKAFTLALAVIVADQISKFWILGSVFPAACQPFVATPAYYTPCSIPVFGPLNLSMVWNQGVSFGLFRGEADWVRWVLVAFSLGVAVALGVWARRIERPLLGAAIGLVTPATSEGPGGEPSPAVTPAAACSDSGSTKISGRFEMLRCPDATSSAQYSPICVDGVIG
jgi:hypothetical protein